MKNLLFTVACIFGCTVSPPRNAMPTSDNVRIIASTYEGKNSAENASNLARHLADDVVWTEAAGFPYAGTYVGYDEIRRNVFERLAADWDDYAFDVEHYIADGDRVVAIGTYSGTYRATGRSFKARVAHVWEVSDGRIRRFEQFVDSGPVRDAMDPANDEGDTTKTTNPTSQ